MFGPSLGAAIGLVFTYVLFSLFLSTVLEAASGVLGLRAKALENAIVRMIEAPDTQPSRWLAWAPIGVFSLFGTPKKALKAERRSGLGGDALDRPDVVDPDNPELHEAATEGPGDIVANTPVAYEAVYGHPLVGGLQGRTRPSYVSRQNFASALIYALRGDRGLASDIEQSVHQLPPGPLREALTTVVLEAAGDVDRFRTGIEAWYDAVMNRLSGEYKRFARLCTFIFGLGLAVAFNVDTVNIVHRLYTEPALRASVEAEAAAYVRAHPDGAPASVAGAELNRRFMAVKDAQDALMTSAAPVGWVDGKFKTLLEGRVAGAALAFMILGWLATAIAGMLGAPFWFDLLQKLVNLRNTGPKPPTPQGAQAAP